MGHRLHPDGVRPLPFVSPIATVDAELRAASEEWVLLQLTTMARPDGHPITPSSRVGRYQDTLAKIEGAWLITSVSADFDHVADWQQDWVEPELSQR
ncbi:hypothetical protein AB0M44_40995 [Streptosporangium subroseum]